MFGIKITNSLACICYRYASNADICSDASDQDEAQGKQTGFLAAFGVMHIKFFLFTYQIIFRHFPICESGIRPVPPVGFVVCHTLDRNGIGRLLSLVLL